MTHTLSNLISLIWFPVWELTGTFSGLNIVYGMFVFKGHLLTFWEVCTQLALLRDQGVAAPVQKLGVEDSSIRTTVYHLYKLVLHRTYRGTSSAYPVVSWRFKGLINELQMYW